MFSWQGRFHTMLLLLFLICLKQNIKIMGLKKGQTNNIKGRPKGALSGKRKEWESMGETLLGEWTDFIKESGNKMIKDGNFEEFYPLYKDMVNYFKPKMQSTTNDTKGTLNIKITEPDGS